VLDFYEVIKRRCSIHKFKSDMIPEETLIRILHAGTLAPNPRNTQPWEFIVVTDNDIKKRVADIKVSKTVQYFESIGTEAAMRRVKAGFADQQEAILSAPVVLVVCYKKDDDLHNYAGTWACIENIVLAAYAEGLGAITMAPRGEEEIKKVLNIPPDYGIASIVPIGFPDEKASFKPRIPVKDKIHMNKW